MADDNMNEKEEKERKGGAALPSWMKGAASVGGRAAGGAGFPGGMAAKLAVLATSKAAILSTVLGGMALGGLVTYNEIHKASVKELPAVGSAFRAGSSSSESGPILSSARGPSSLDMASRANKGIFGGSASAAKPEAKAEDAGADSKDAAKSAEIGQDGKPVAGDPQAQAQQMAEALMKGQSTDAQGGQGAGLQRKFGNMTSNLGAGNRQLAGGAGLSGGIGQGFGQAKLNNSAVRQMSAMSGARRAQVTQAKTAVANRGSSLSGAAARRLDKMNMAMGGARKEGAATQAAIHSQQWEGAQAGGQAIQGAGAGGGGFSSDEGGGEGSPVNPTSDASVTPNPATSVPDTGDSGNKTPYQGMLNLAVGMLMLASVIITVIGVLSIVKRPLQTNPWTVAVAETLEGIQLAMLAAATIMAGIAAVMGGMIAGQGQSGQGTILCVAGGIEAAAGTAALLWPNKMPASLLALAGVAGLMGSITSLLAK
ncbi:MAG: hypothetical protein PHF00_14100 [Elusimicrobia bacterium]|nr:hypothetical protein [Elusimicrobiota bacterium]